MECTGETRYVYRILVGKPLENEYLKERKGDKTIT
jgi:hypothetical protein